MKTAVEKLVARHGPEGIAARLDAAYGAYRADDALDETLATLQFHSLDREDWTWCLRQAPSFPSALNQEPRQAKTAR